MSNVPEQRASEDAICHSEARYQGLVDLCPAALLVHCNFVVLFANPAALRLFGATDPSQLIGKDLLENVHCDVRALAMQQVQSLQDNQTQTPAIEQRLTDLQGNLLDVEVQGRTCDWQGHSAVQIIVRDISDRIRAEEQRQQTVERLRISEERYALSVEGSQNGLWDWDVRTGENHVSALWEQMLGYAAGEFPRNMEAWREFQHPEDRPRVDAVLSAYLNRETESFGATFRMRHKDGSYRWIHSRGVALFDSEGKPFRMAGTHVDITERKHKEEQVRLLSTVAAASRNAIIITDAQQRVLYVNPGFERITGYTLEEVEGRRPSDFLEGPDTDALTTERLVTALAADEPVSLEILYYRKDGTPFWNDINIAPVCDDTGTVTHFVGINNDTTARKNAERDVRQSEERYALAVEGSQNGIWDWNVRTGETYYSARMKQIMGYAESEFPNRVETWISHIHPDDVPQVDAARAAHFNRETDAFEVEFRIRQKDGSYHWVLGRGVARFDSEGKPYRMAGSHIDITEHKLLTEQLNTANRWHEAALEQLSLQQVELCATNARLEAMATTDGLTGLKNHRALQERLREAYDRARRYNTPLSVLMLDVDKFKEYNDAFGHPAGDAVLRQFARIMQEMTRTSDVVARYGGEEFAVLLPETDMEEARIVAERFRNAVETSEWVERLVTVSIGAATLAPTTAHPDALLADADVALYRSKHRGRNCVTHATDTVDKEALDTEAARWYDGLIKKLLAAQSETLVSASQQIRETLFDAYDATIVSWSRILDLKHKEPEGHSQRVTEMMVRLVRSLKMNEEEVMYARWGTLLHDVGRMAVPDCILHKPGPLTEAEWVVVRQHTTLAHEMLAPIKFLGPAMDIAYCHHEKWDGSGYPQGLKGEEIPLLARLFAVIDVHDALTNDRPYRSAWPEEKVRTYLQDEAGTQFDPRAVEAFLTMVKQNGATNVSIVYTPSAPPSV